MLRSLRLTPFVFVASLASLACSGPTAENADVSEEGELRGATSMIALLDSVPPGTAWKDVPKSVKRKLQNNADAVDKKARHDWGKRGLDEKEERLLEAPTAEMVANYDRVMKRALSPEHPEGFVLSTGVANAELAKQLKRVYLLRVARYRQALAMEDATFKDWDGGDILDFQVRDQVLMNDLNDYSTEIQAAIAAIPAADLNDVDKALALKGRIVARQMSAGKVNTAREPERLWGMISTYDTPNVKPFKDDEEFLLTVNAHTFLENTEMNVGTVDTFNWDLPGWTDPGLLADMGLDPATTVAGKHLLTLTGWWSERVNADKDAKKKCTIYSAKDRNALWLEFTADQVSNFDGSQTMEQFAAQYHTVSEQRLANIRSYALGVVDSFATEAGLTTAQKAQVAAAIQAETKQAAMKDALYVALDAATGSNTASTALKAKFDALTMVGGYAPGEALRQADVDTVNAMYEDVKAFLDAEYGGHTVDLVAQLPPTVNVTTGGSTFAGNSVPPTISVGLRTKQDKADLYLTLLHEAKHAIDYHSKAPVQGGAFEGAATIAEQMVAKKFVEQRFASEAANIPYYLLDYQASWGNVTATTDATLQIFLRKSCGGGQPNSIDFAKDIFASYGVTDPVKQTGMSRRAHLREQYLEYGYGSINYGQLLAWFQSQLPAGAPTIDPFTLQSCAMTSPAQDAAAVTKLKTCLGLP